MKLSDVTVYLENADSYKIPVGIFSSRGTSGEYKSLSPYTLKKRKLLIPEICKRLKSCPDAIIVKQAAEATMLSAAL